MDTKKCFKCKLEKPISEYYKHAQMADGHLNKCKECTKKDSNKHREENLDQVKEYDRKRSQLPHRVALRKRVYEEFKHSEDYSEKRNVSTRKYRNKYPEKAKARAMVSYHLRSGHISKKPCEKCGNIETEAHHEDYSKPLDITWLCESCHKKIHVEKRRMEK